MKVGVLADCQYADIPDQHQEGRTQRFQEVPKKLQSALENMAGCDYIIHLGDIIQSQESEELTRKELETICSIFESFPIPKLHVLGNHCIGTLSRSMVMERLHIPEPGYYSLDLSAIWKCIVLDTTEMSGHSGYPEDSWQCQEAKAYLEKHPWKDEQPHMVAWNGGITHIQHEWLVKELEDASIEGKQVIVCSHHQINPSAARRTHLAWNFSEIHQTIASYGSVVKLILSGHDHIGGGCRVVGAGESIQVYITVPAVLEAPHDSNNYMIFEFDDSREPIKIPDDCSKANGPISATATGSRSTEIAKGLCLIDSTGSD